MHHGFAGLEFKNFDLGLISVMSAVLYMIGLIIFKKFLFQTSWRMIYIYTSTVGAVFSVLQVRMKYEEATILIDA